VNDVIIFRIFNIVYLLFVLVVSGCSRETARPNILLIVADEQ